MYETTENERILPPAFMATTRQKILLKDHQIQECALDFDSTSPIINAFLSIGNAAINLFENIKK